MCSTWKSWEGSRSWSWTTHCNCQKNSGYISSKLILGTGDYLVIELMCHMSEALHFLVLKWEEMKTEESPCKSHIWPNCHHLILQQCCGFFKESFYGAVFQTKLHWYPIFDVFQILNLIFQQQNKTSWQKGKFTRKGKWPVLKLAFKADSIWPFWYAPGPDVRIGALNTDSCS